MWKRDIKYFGNQGEEASVAEKRTKLYHHLKKWMEKAIAEYGMIQEGDKVLVGVSGGADSMALLDLLAGPMVFTPAFELLAVHIDLGFPGSDADLDTLQGIFQAGGHPFIIDRTDYGPLSHSDFNRKNPCFLCSRLRRKRIFEIADAQGCNKIAFAHHRDDIIETLLINMFYGREISTMMPNQSIFGGKLHIIRPLAYLPEEPVKKYARERCFPVVENRCPTGKTSRRRYIKDLLNSLERDNREIRHNLWTAMSHVKPDYLLMKG